MATHLLRWTRAVTIAGLCGTLLSCLPLVEGVDYDLEGQQVRMSFLHTSDLHSRLIPYDFSPLRTDLDLGLVAEAGPFGGATRMAALIKRERSRAERIMHLDSGDSFQGAPIYNLNHGEVEFRFFSRMGLDAAVVGNHEFDSGALNFSEQARDNATFPLLAANYYWDNPELQGSNQAAYYTSPYTIANIKGVRVGIIGMANISSLNSIVEGGNSLQVTPLEQNEAARAYIELLRPVTDLLVVTSHLGLYEDQDLIRGYDAFYEYGRIKAFVERENAPWILQEWFGPEGADSSVVRVWIPGISGLDILFGGHLHVVLNPPQTLIDPSGRKVLLVHSGAFSKYLGRLEAVIQMPEADADAPDGAEVLSHDYRVLPIDGLWCNDAMRDYYRSQFWVEGTFRRQPEVLAAMEECTAQEDRETMQLLQAYMLEMDVELSLSMIFSYSPTDIVRRNNSTGGDSPLGNMTSDSMRKRRRVEAEMALTNSLGIRDNLYAGPLTQESMFNVFPFENTINIMYLSGGEMQEMFDFVATRSAERGCASQAQISGAKFVMDCAQAQLNAALFTCSVPTDCPDRVTDGHAPWECRFDVAGQDGGRCWAHPSTDIEINRKPLDPNATYKIAVNDYIAKGGSGFSVLKRNTTRIETGIPLRDSLIGYMKDFCSCDDILADERQDGIVVGSNGQPCGVLMNGLWEVPESQLGFCQATQLFQDSLAAESGTCTCGDVLTGRSSACGEISEAQVEACLLTVPPGPQLGRCTCRSALQGDAEACGYITQQVRSFCQNPTRMSLAVGHEDGRIGRRMK